MSTAFPLPGRFITEAEAAEAPLAEPSCGCRVAVLRQDLRAIVGDGAAFSLMVGMGETYLPAFALALGLEGVAAGLLATGPMIAGALIQLVAPAAARRVGSRRRWIVGCACGQAASLLLIALAAALGWASALLVFGGATLYWAAGMATGPAWNTWMESVVPRAIRPRFFARRVYVSQIAILAGFVTAGLLLQFFACGTATMYVFAGVFLVAGAARLISAVCLASQSERLRMPVGRDDTPIRDVLVRFQGNSSLRLVVYLLAVQAAVYTSGPYFTPYMLSGLEWSYGRFMLLIAVAYAGKIAALPLWGKLAKRLGAGRLLVIGGLGVVPISGLWALSNSFAFLAILQVFSGIVWAAFELAMQLLFFEAIPKRDRTSMLTIYNLGNAVAMVGGALFGALLLQSLGEGLAAYLIVFVVSSVGRAATIPLLLRLPLPAGGSLSLITRTVALRPAVGSLQQPVLISMAGHPSSRLAGPGALALSDLVEPDGTCKT